jgi:basic membrane lipoprotein Med (substrate-binding protein (PBP1-ABC) superfamily)
VNITIIFSIITAAVTLGGIFIAIGVFKGKISQHDEKLKATASKDELAAAIKRSDEMLAIMTKRAEEDRTKGQGQWHEFHDILVKHAERIGTLETQQTTFQKSIDELKSDIKSGFKEMHYELKELQNELKELGKRN